MGKRIGFYLTLALLSVNLGACRNLGLVSGKALFQDNCANCHGVYAAGDGPASVDIGLPIPDLRYLTQSNAGIFPADLIYRIIDGQSDAEAHFPRRMPVWGYEFALRESDDDRVEQRVQEKIRALTEYLESIQLVDELPR